MKKVEMMKNIVIFFLILNLAGLGASILCAQTSQQDKQEKQESEKALVEITQTRPPTYNPEGRRDPFKNLVAGKDVKDKMGAGGVPQLFIDDINLIGIVKTKGRLTAVINGPQGFPYFIKVGDKFSDGYVVSIKETQVVFRKINDRGIPLMRPKDIIKEINPEER
jgi:Tfp pilus assembly protein PilP